ncbi:MAG: hypothetical protein RR844_09820 [Clostridium sp.]
MKLESIKCNTPGVSIAVSEEEVEKEIVCSDCGWEGLTEDLYELEGEIYCRFCILKRGAIKEVTTISYIIDGEAVFDEDEFEDAVKYIGGSKI